MASPLIDTWRFTTLTAGAPLNVWVHVQGCWRVTTSRIKDSVPPDALLPGHQT
jgi:hypothetical protein